MSSLKKRVYETVAEPPKGYRLGEYITFGILLLIAFNVLVGVFETVEYLEKDYHNFFYYVEFVSVVIFTIEYVLKFWACTSTEEYSGTFRGRLKFMLAPMSIIDLLAILPFYLSAFFVLDLRFVRVLRLFRLFRLFRSGKLAESFTTLINVVKSKKEELGISVLILILVLVFSSSVMYLVEHQVPNTQFTSVPAAMWWGMMTITTIGYGDMYPITTLGRVIGSLVGFMGICVFALPVGILGAGFSEYMNQKANKAKQSDEIDERAELSDPIESSATVDTAVDTDSPSSSSQCPHCGHSLH